MDTLTHSILGAAIGVACAGPKLGRRSAWWGAFGGALPDIDMAVRAIGGPWAEMAYHRSLTHTLWFCPVVGPAIGYGLWRFYHRTYAAARGGAASHPGAPPMRKPWMLALTAAVVAHPLLDLFTTYGTQLFWPMGSHRFALDAISIVDPFYTLTLLAVLIVSFRYEARTRVRLCAGAITFTTAYLFYGWWLNAGAEDHARRQLAAEGVTQVEVAAYPTPLQLHLRRIVARAPDAIRVGKLTMWSPHPVTWKSTPVEQHRLIDATRASPHGQLFEWFAMGQIHARMIESEGALTVAIDDLRYAVATDAPEGFWGIRARFTPGGALLGPIETFRQPLPAPFLPAVGEVLRDAFAGDRGGSPR